MPRALPRPCTTPGCPEITEGGPCPKHLGARRRASDAKRDPKDKSFYNSARWQNLRKLVLHRDPVCTECNQQPSTDVDHRIALAKGGTHSEDNLRGLCGPCHARKTALEDGGFGRQVAGNVAP